MKKHTLYWKLSKSSLCKILFITLFIISAFACSSNNTEQEQISNNNNEAEQSKPTTQVTNTTQSLSARKRLAKATSYYCYYGLKYVKALSNYDVVILSGKCPPAVVHKLNDSGVVTLGYLSVGESHSALTGDGKGPGGKASWYFDKNNDNKPDENGTWGSYFANANNSNWRENRVALARKRIKQKGFDGLFLDTVDTCVRYPKTQPGMVKLIKQLRQQFPDAPIVANRGFPILSQIGNSIDGVMTESFTLTYDFNTKKYMQRSKSSLDASLNTAKTILEPAMHKYNIQVFILDYAMPNQTSLLQMAANRAATFGFLWCAAPITLDKVYNLNIKAKPNDRFRHNLATPESMSITVSKTSNGFPQGTKITPSSCYAGYTVKPLVDGRNHSKATWNNAAWASAQRDTPAWVKFTFPHTMHGGAITIKWAVDSGAIHTSKQFKVQVKTKKVAKWHTVTKISNNNKKKNTIDLSGNPFLYLRIFQKPGKGSINRPNLMWISEVEYQGDTTITN